jgi:chondroitin AC lyase
VSDGRWGLAAFDFLNEGLKARKSWFCFDREIVCLGAGISCQSEKPVLTSVNQCLLNGRVLTAGQKRRNEFSASRYSAEDIRWVHHDSTGYYFPKPSKVTMTAEVQQGSWHDLSSYYPADEMVRKTVFSLWINHGIRPDEDRYAYAVLPGIKPREMDSYLKNWPVRILSNSPVLQAVRHSGLRLTQIAFYEPGELKIPGGPAVSVDKPCLIMLEEIGRERRLSLSNPENEPCTVNVRITARLDGPGCRWMAGSKTTKASIELPAGIEAGRTVVVTLRQQRS